MLSYRHAFHAGNFADVLKHLVLIEILDHLKKKDKPFCYIDTHAGPGEYALTGEFALKNREFDNGIGKLWLREDLPSSVRSYVDVVRAFNGSGRLKRYPGSPSIARQLLRRNDRLFLYELHATEIRQLVALFAHDRRAQVLHADGLRDSLGVLPPAQHRALVLIDPSYEIKTDYSQVVATLVKMHQRFATGTYALWYPVIERSRNHRLERAVEGSGIKNVQLFELGIGPDSHGLGMTAGGMIVVNPPWTLKETMKQCLPWLAEVLAGTGEGHCRMQTLVGE
ncbi:23S rRNA (adenine(2030)-N(6))-methyltransferase RlmJ [Methylosarcina fibrata]|uniref:23S rRNA (adenine(2030)-N(6))-methyltransferase RlmJ n=1 Tax=Methylosarcina fibrata TaxID=105972 RepID=UPI00035DFD7B|nr:23S rRNA (adenine(2030)-N(6))-methyltransferase RlmJ [Methylosarcina fibrata]